MSDLNPQKHTNFDYKDILEYLKKVKINVIQERYIISFHEIEKRISYLFK